MYTQCACIYVHKKVSAVDDDLHLFATILLEKEQKLFKFKKIVAKCFYDLVLMGGEGERSNHLEQELALKNKCVKRGRGAASC